MRISAICTWSIVVILFVCSVARAADGQSASVSGLASLLSNLNGKTWATLSDQGGFQLRLLTAEEKTVAAETIDKYRQLRTSEDTTDSEEADRIIVAYRSMPSDVRAARFYKVRVVGPDAIELKSDTLHAILPMSSVRIVLLGPTGSLAAPRFSRSSTSAGSGRSQQEFIEALRNSRRGSSGGPLGSSRGNVSGGSLGSSARPIAARDEDMKSEAKATWFFLKYAAAKNVLDIIREVYADYDLRMAADERLNAVIIHGDPKGVKQIEQLIGILDRNEVHEKKDDTSAETSTLKTYRIQGSDVQTTFQVLQTLLAGQANVRLGLDATTNKLIVFARESEHATVKAAIEKLGSPE